VKDYRPDELSIKTEGDVLVVMGKHVIKSEVGGSYVSKQFEQVKSPFSDKNRTKKDSLQSRKDSVLNYLSLLSEAKGGCLEILLGIEEK